MTHDLAAGTFKSARGFKVDLSSDEHSLEGVFQVCAVCVSCVWLLLSTACFWNFFPQPRDFKGYRD